MCVVVVVVVHVFASVVVRVRVCVCVCVAVLVLKTLFLNVCALVLSVSGWHYKYIEPQVSRHVDHLKLPLLRKIRYLGQNTLDSRRLGKVNKLA